MALLQKVAELNSLDSRSSDDKLPSVFRSRNTGRLRAGRVTSPGAAYFITACTHRRRNSFAHEDRRATVAATLAGLVESGDVEWMCATVMPDHLHCLFALGWKLPLSRLIAKAKGCVTKQMNERGGGVFEWQENVFEHRCRGGEQVEDYAFYIFMNPYRAGLCSLDRRWIGWVCTKPARFRLLSPFEAENAVPAEWVGKAAELERRLTTGH